MIEFEDDFGVFEAGQTKRAAYGKFTWRFALRASACGRMGEGDIQWRISSYALRRTADVVLLTPSLLFLPRRELLDRGSGDWPFLALGLDS